MNCAVKIYFFFDRNLSYKNHNVGGGGNKINQPRRRRIRGKKVYRNNI